MDALNKFDNQEIWHCYNMGRRINFNSETISLCHEAQVGDRVLMKYGELTPDRYFADIFQILESTNQDSNFPCRTCSKCKKEVFQFRKISFVTICTSMYCNSKCIYCTAHFGAENSGYDPVPYLEMFHQQGLFSPNCYFDWGGGEPTLNPHYENTVNWLHQRGYYQRFNTNAILFSQMTYQALKEKKGNVRVSVDSGTSEAYRKVKGTDNFDNVWDNIREYCSVSDAVYIKYNVCNYNSDLSEIDNFIDQCIKTGVKNIVVDGEINSYQPERNAGPFYFTEKELRAAKYLENEAKLNGLDVEIGWYAFSVRPEYDAVGKLKLPDVYYDNIDTNIISSGVKVTTFATVDQLLEKIASNPRIPVVIWGNGNIQYKIESILNAEGVQVKFFIDSENKNQITKIERIKNVIWELAYGLSKYKALISKYIDIYDFNKTTFDRLKSKYDKVHLILAGNRWKETLQEINNEKYMVNGFVYYIHEVHFHQYKNQI